AAPGEVLNLRDVEQALENFQRIPTVAADVQIVPADGDGALPGQSDLVISWQQRSRWRINLSLDDSGSESTGKWQGGATLSLDNQIGRASCRERVESTAVAAAWQENEHRL